MPRRLKLVPSLLVAAAMAGPPALAQNAPTADLVIDLVGEWQAQVHEDQPHRIPGPFLGDYTGLPINAAARQKAESWDATILSQPERQTQAHPAQYSMRGPRPDMRISEIRDPVTEQLTGLSIVGTYGRADRTIWLDGRPHPSVYAEHTWGGFSTGTFHSGELTVTTTHMKMGVIQRIGVPASPYAVMTEHFFRHGLLMTMISVIDDPIYLEEPFVRSQTWLWSATQAVPAAVPFEPVDELAGKELGWVPHYPLGTHHLQFAETTGLPFEATQGGAKTTYPEYQLELQKLFADMKARNAAAKKDK
jgi:hypothetical protein